MLQLVCESKEVSEYATSGMVFLLRRLVYRRGMLQSDGEPSIVALKTATLCWQPVCRIGFA